MVTAGLPAELGQLEHCTCLCVERGGAAALPLRTRVTAPCQIGQRGQVEENALHAARDNSPYFRDKKPQNSSRLTHAVRRHVRRRSMSYCSTATLPPHDSHHSHGNPATNTMGPRTMFSSQNSTLDDVKPLP